MLFTPPSDDSLYQALIERDPAYEGHAFVCVKTTGIFCRLTCTARNPKRENVLFHSSVADCVEAGFRPCKRCRPMDPPGGANPLITELLAAIDAEPERRWVEGDVAALGFDASTVRRAFRRHYGMTFLQVARARRLGNAAARIEKGDKVIEAQLDAGYESGSGFREAFARLIGEAPARARGRGFLTADWIETPLGPMTAIADEKVLHLLEFPDRKALTTEVRRLQARQEKAIRHGRTAPIEAAKQALGRYFAGEAAAFELPFGSHGTEFEKRVWQELMRIPLGETRSYGEIARTLGCPTGSRAVARANGANQLAILIPCHRVIGADGSLTGYAGKLWRKKWLLEHEQRVAVAISARRPPTE